MKSQSDIISAVVIVIIAMSLVSSAYFWGIPLIQKSQHQAMIERAYKYFDINNVNSLPGIIGYVAKYGGEQNFQSDIDGIWFLYVYDSPSQEKNSIQFTFFSKTTNIANDVGWIPLSTSNTQQIGNVGIDEPIVVFGRADKTADGFNITYKVWLRELEESPTKGYRYVLLSKSPSGPFTSSGKTVRISRGSVYSQVEGSKTLIITEIKILLI